MELILLELLASFAAVGLVWDMVWVGELGDFGWEAIATNCVL